MGMAYGGELHAWSCCSQQIRPAVSSQGIDRKSQVVSPRILTRSAVRQLCFSVVLSRTALGIVDVGALGL